MIMTRTSCSSPNQISSGKPFEKITFSFFEEIHQLGFFEQVVAFGLHFKGHLALFFYVEALKDIGKLPFSDLTIHSVLALKDFPNHILIIQII